MRKREIVGDIHDAGKEAGRFSDAAETDMPSFSEMLNVCFSSA